MAELIDREALIAEYDRVHVGKPGGARKLMEKAPAVDAVEVVRCKDCGRGKRGVDNIVLCNHPSGKRILMTAYGFCNYGQRREDG